jgi:hypothetical protein
MDSRIRCLRADDPRTCQGSGRVGGRRQAEDIELKLGAQIGRLRSQGQGIRATAAEDGRSPNNILQTFKTV